MLLKLNLSVRRSENTVRVQQKYTPVSAPKRVKEYSEAPESVGRVGREGDLLEAEQIGSGIHRIVRLIVTSAVKARRTDSITRPIQHAVRDLHLPVVFLEMIQVWWWFERFKLAAGEVAVNYGQ